MSFMSACRDFGLWNLQSCFRTMVRTQVLKLATCEIEQTEDEGFVLVIHVEGYAERPWLYPGLFGVVGRAGTDEIIIEEHRQPWNTPEDDEKTVPLMADIGRRFLARNPMIRVPKPKLTEKQLDEMYARMKGGLGKAVPEIEEERMKYN